jgi:hypothetical protein
MKDVFIIKEIIEISLDNILIKLYFNIKTAEDKLLLEISISDDGETIIVNQKPSWAIEREIIYDSFSVKNIINIDDELKKLIDTNIVDIQYGIGNTLETNRCVIYYLKIVTDKNKFLFFNNGDQGAYSFDKIDDILLDDIYNIKWSTNHPDYYSFNK